MKTILPATMAKAVTVTSNEETSIPKELVRLTSLLMVIENRIIEAAEKGLSFCNIQLPAYQLKVENERLLIDHLWYLGYKANIYLQENKIAEDTKRISISWADEVEESNNGTTYSK